MTSAAAATRAEREGGVDVMSVLRLSFEAWSRPLSVLTGRISASLVTP